MLHINFLIGTKQYKEHIPKRKMLCLLQTKHNIQTHIKMAPAIMPGAILHASLSAIINDARY